MRIRTAADQDWPHIYPFLVETNSASVHLWRSLGSSCSRRCRTRTNIRDTGWSVST